MNVLQFSLGQLQANCYLLIKENGCLVIDPADDASFILEKVQRRGLVVEALLATHGHFDHVMAVGEIQAALPQVPFYIHEKDLFLLKRLQETAKNFLGYEPHILPPQRVTSFNVKQQQIGLFNFDVISTPGHTPGSVCYSFHDSPDAEILFTGDTLFAGAIGRYDFSYSSKKDLKNSLEELFKFPEKTAIFPGHGGESTIADEKKQRLDFL